MKKIILAGVFILALNAAKSQVIDTSFKAMTACRLVPFKAKFSDTANTTHLGVRVISDDLRSSCTLYWAMMDASGNITVHGNATIEGTDYATLKSSNNLYPFVFVRNKYSLTFKND